MQGTGVRSTTAGNRRAELSILIVVGLLLISAVGAGAGALYREFYSPSAFVEQYLSLLSTGRAADALRLPGVAVDRQDLGDSGIDSEASDALLRSTALAPLTDVEIVSESADGEATTVTVAYHASGHAGKSTFTIAQDGWTGIVPRWRFERSPLAAVDLSLFGSDAFTVNGFAIERGQVSAAGGAADPLQPLPMLVFTPGVYSVTVDTPISASRGVSVLADAPLTSTSVDVQAEATREFVDVVQQRVEDFLTQCTTQQVLQPTACPFGFDVDNRVDDTPTWTIAQQPVVRVQPDGANWKIPATDAVAHIEVSIRSLFDGSIKHVSEDVPFQINGTISILSDGSASIKVGTPDSE